MEPTKKKPARPLTKKEREAMWAEQSCGRCQGAGLLPDTQAPEAWNVALCPTCNGKGYVLVKKMTPTPVPFAHAS